MINQQKKTKKIAGVLLLPVACTLMLISCPNILSVNDKHDPGNGMGYITFSFDSNTSRTIKPVTPVVSAMKFYLTFYVPSNDPSNEDEIVHEEEYSHEDLLAAVIQLNSGTYKLKVYAYQYDDDEMLNPVARFIDDVTIGIGSGTGLIIKLETIIDDDEASVGTFNWNIELNGVIASEVTAVMYVEKLDHNDDFIVIPDSRKYLIGTESGGEALTGMLTRTVSEPLKAGYYNLFFKLERNGKTVEINEILYIYKNLESIYDTLIISNDTFTESRYLVTFYSESNIIGYGAVVEGNAASLVMPDNPEKSGYGFVGWFLDYPALENAWSNEYNPTGRFNLYAKFLPNLTGTVVIAENDDHTILSLGTTTISGQGVSYQWLRNGNPIPGATGTSYTFLTSDSGNFQLEVKRENYYGSVLSNSIERTGPRGSSPENPLLITSLAALVRIGTNVDFGGGIWTNAAYYRQTLNISINSPSWNPIGTINNQFTGGYDGGGFIINMDMGFNNTAPINAQGLFGYIGTGGEVKNINLRGIHFISNNTDGSGMIAGVNRGLIENCSVTANNFSSTNIAHAIISGGDNTGGVVGMNHGTVRYSSFTGSVFNNGNNAGGVAGNNAGIIEKSYSNGSVVSSSSNAGGIAGNSSGFIRNSHSMGVINNSNNTGGIAGNNSGTIEFCYSINSVGAHSNIGGIAGNNSGTIENCAALNPNLTKTTTGDFTASIGRITGTGGILGNNRALDETRIIILGTGDSWEKNNDLNSKDGLDTPIGIPLSGVFSSWDSSVWLIPGINLGFNDPLPVLVGTSVTRTVNNQPVSHNAARQSPPPELIRPVNWIGNDYHATPITANAHEIIRFDEIGGKQGWFYQAVNGEWLEGEMVQSELPPQVNITSQVNALNGANLQSLGNNQRRTETLSIGTMYWTVTGNNGVGNLPSRTITVEIYFNVTFRTADFYMTVANSSTYVAPRSSNGTVITEVAGGITRRYVKKENDNVIIAQWNYEPGTRYDIRLDIESFGDWTFIPQAQANEVQDIFKETHTRIDGNNTIVTELYYWEDSGIGRWSWGPTSFLPPTAPGSGVASGPPNLQTGFHDRFENRDTQLLVNIINSNIPVADHPFYEHADGPNRIPGTIQYDHPTTGGRTTRDVVVNDVHVGTVDIILDSVTTTIAGDSYNITNGSVDVTLVFDLDPDFSQFVQSYTCNDNVVVNNTITLTGLNASTLLDIVFNFGE